MINQLPSLVQEYKSVYPFFPTLNMLESVQDLLELKHFEATPL